MTKFLTITDNTKLDGPPDVERRVVGLVSGLQTYNLIARIARPAYVQPEVSVQSVKINGSGQITDMRFTITDANGRSHTISIEED